MMITHLPHDDHSSTSSKETKDDMKGFKDHDNHAGCNPEMFRKKFWLSLILTLPVVFWSVHIQILLGYQASNFFGLDWIPPVLGTVIYFYGGWVFTQGAWKELINKLPGMMTLIYLAITVACVFSWVVQLNLIQADALWWELGTLVTIMLLGHWMEMKSIVQAQGALQELAKLLPDTVTRLIDEGEEKDAGTLAAWGIILTPAVGAVLMSASTVIVACNAQLLRRVVL